jgi:hypothetical protein
MNGYVLIVGSRQRHTHTQWWSLFLSLLSWYRRSMVHATAYMQDTHEYASEQADVSIGRLYNTIVQKASWTSRETLVGIFAYVAGRKHGTKRCGISLREHVAVRLDYIRVGMINFV